MHALWLVVKVLLVLALSAALVLLAVFMYLLRKHGCSLKDYRKLVQAERAAKRAAK